MIKTLVKGSVFGGLILLAWSAFSWMALPWHMKSFSSFKDEAAVLKTLAAQAPASGIYLVPNVHAAMAAAPADKKKEVEAACMEKMKAGPSGMLVVHKEGMDMQKAMGGMMLKGFLIGALGALAVTWVLLHVSGGFGTRTAIALLAGVTGAVVTHLSYWNWWNFPDTYTCTEIADGAAGWLLVSLVLAKITGKRGRR